MPTTKKSRITCEIDLDKNGKHLGFLRLPHSVHRSAYGWLPIPIVSIKNGDGPRILLQSGNHGDEYEGQVVFTKLARELRPKDIRGQVIINPTANAPAARAGRRTSPLDDGGEGNLNRCFPGDPDGSPTRMIAHFIESELLARVDYSIDLHSGGSSLMILPSVDLRHSKDAKRMRRLLEVARAFAAPITYVGHGGGDNMMSAAAERKGVIHFATELGGGGTVTPAYVRIGEAGVRRVLKHVGILSPNAKVEPPGETRLMDLGGADYYVYAPDDGLFEPFVELGAEIRKGQPAGAIHFPETPWREAQIARFGRAGTVICKRVPSRTERGDCLFHLATDQQG